MARLDYRAEFGSMYRDNLRNIFGMTDGATGSNWYAVARHFADILSEDTNTPIAHTIGTIAAGSVNTQWGVNAAWAYTTLHGVWKSLVTRDHMGSVIEANARVHSTDPENYDACMMALTIAKSDAKKTKNFFCNIRTGGKNCDHIVPCVTIDRWATRLAYATCDSMYVPSGNEYDAIAEAYRDVAAEYGLDVAEFQAILWCAFVA